MYLVYYNYSNAGPECQANIWLPQVIIANLTKQKPHQMGLKCHQQQNAPTWTFIRSNVPMLAIKANMPISNDEYSWPTLCFSRKPRKPHLCGLTTGFPIIGIKYVNMKYP